MNVVGKASRIGVLEILALSSPSLVFDVLFVDEAESELPRVGPMCLPQMSTLFLIAQPRVLSPNDFSELSFNGCVDFVGD